MTTTRRRWYRMYHDMTSDPALHVVANLASCGRCEVVSVYLMLLDCASKNRGLTNTFDHDEAAVTLMIDVNVVDNIVEALKKRKKIDRETSRVIGWDKFNPSSTERVRRSRAKRQEASKLLPQARMTHHLPMKEPKLTPAQISMQQRRFQQQNFSILDKVK